MPARASSTFARAEKVPFLVGFTGGSKGGQGASAAGRDSKSGRASYQAIGTPATAGNDIAVAQLAALDNDAAAAGAFAQPQGVTVARTAFVFENTETAIAMPAFVDGVHREHEDSIIGVFDCCQGAADAALWLTRTSCHAIARIVHDNDSDN